MAVTFGEELGSPTEKWGEGGSLIARQVLRCAWEDRYALLLELGSNGGKRYPHTPTVNCFARGATIDGRGKNDEYATGMNKYENALLTVMYSTEAPQGVGPHRFVTEEMSPTRFDRKIDIGKLKWTDVDGPQLSPAEAPTYAHGSIDYVLTFWDIMAIPVGALMLNVTNDEDVPAFLYPIVFPAETLRHLTAVITRTVGLGMAGHYRLQYRWTYNDKTWSKHQREDGTWEQIWHTKNAAIVRWYPPVDFTLMYPS